MNEESILANIEKEKWEDLRSDFKQGVNSLITEVRNDIKPKVIVDKTLTGRMFLHLAIEYTNTLNSG